MLDKEDWKEWEGVVGLFGMREEFLWVEDGRMMMIDIVRDERLSCDEEEEVEE